MASSYPPVPAHRMLLDRDGSSLHYATPASITMMSADDMRTVNDEAGSQLALQTGSNGYVLAFPELRDVKAMYMGVSQSDPDDWVDVAVDGSPDTTTGLDGAWSEMFALNRVQEGATRGWWGHVAPGDYRRYVRAVSAPEAATGLRALRIGMFPQSDATAWRLVSVHVFGSYAYEANPHRLQLWHPWLDQPVPAGHFDWGNVPYSSSAQQSFRVRNLSPSRTAQQITLSVDALTDANPPFARQLLLSYDGSGYAGTTSIISLSPGATSRVATVRRVTPHDAVGGAWAQRVLAGAAVWTESP
jgi:hypothetical protein